MTNVGTIAVLVDGEAGSQPRQITVDALQASVDAVAPQLKIEVCNTGTLRDRSIDDYAGLLAAPGSPYDDPEAAEDWIRTARERGLPLLGN